MVHATFSDLPPFPDDIRTSPIARISLADLESQDEKAGLAALEACQTYGFFHLDLQDSPTGQQLLHESEELLDLSQRSLTAVPREEKMKYHLQKGVSMFGYKADGTIKKTDPERRPDSTEFWNIAKDHLLGITPSREYPPAIEEAKPILASFARGAHETGMTVLRNLAIRLGLGPEELTVLNDVNKPAGDHIRLTHKWPHPTDKNAVGLPSHTDFGSVTILFNWLGGLQIQSRSPGTEGQWEFVKPLPGHAIINLGDAMVKFTNGALKSAKHRVVPAPGAQGDIDRYSVVYFVRPCNESLMKPVPKFEGNSHVKVGGKVSLDDEENKVYTAGEWMVKRAIQMGS
jgi:isopenicillin N synthase-like dioxygenase